MSKETELEKPQQEHVDWLEKHGFTREGEHTWWYESIAVTVSFRIFPSRWQSNFVGADKYMESVAETPIKSLSGLLEKLALFEEKLVKMKKRSRKIQSMVQGSSLKPKYSYIARFDIDRGGNKSYVVRTRKAGMLLSEDFNVTSGFLYFKADDRDEAEYIAACAFSKWEGEELDLTYVNGKLTPC